MLRAKASRWCLVATFVTHASVVANQVPLGSPSLNYNYDSTLTDWSFDLAPQPNATDHLVFETVHSLLQHWPNTRMRNGHTIVPGIIPKGTLLYHGTPNHEIPPGPEWAATDPEHSFLFCRDTLKLGKGCWQLTLATTRPLKVVYFDGSSAVKLPYGSLDAQDLIAWGKSRPEAVYVEYERIIDLCKWGKDYGVDGFVRMEMDFEVVLCDFTSGVDIVSFSNLVAIFQNPTVPRFGTLARFEVMVSGSWHNRFPGDTRIQLDLPGLVSFYDTQLAPSLVATRVGQERWDHRVQGISGEDILAARSRLAEALTRPRDQSSGVDWATLFNVIVDRYAERLELMQYLLNLTATDSNEILDLASKTQIQLRVMVTPYALFSAIPTEPLNKTDLDWVTPIFKLCATTHTSSIDSEVPSMTSSERLLLQAVQGTNREICRVVTKMWASGVYAGLDPYVNTKELPNIDEVTQLRIAWAAELNRLMSWLDWSVWVKCKPACGPEEMCFLPTWPIGFPRRPKSTVLDAQLSNITSSAENFRSIVLDSLADEGWDYIRPGPDDWIRPQSRCVTRVVPYDY